MIEKRELIPGDKPYGRNLPFILIAEDDADDRFLLETAFDECGFCDQIVFVENGVELLDFLRGQQAPTTCRYPAFILLDLNMPKKDGREALKEIKQHPLFRRIPVVVFTTTKNEKDISRCYELGANSYIVKPVSFDDLVSVIATLRNYWYSTSIHPCQI
jgi:two-component system response regulator